MCEIPALTALALLSLVPTHGHDKPMWIPNIARNPKNEACNVFRMAYTNGPHLLSPCTNSWARDTVLSCRESWLISSKPLRQSSWLCLKFSTVSHLFDKAIKDATAFWVYCLRGTCLYGDRYCELLRCFIRMFNMILMNNVPVLNFIFTKYCFKTYLRNNSN